MVGRNKSPRWSPNQRQRRLDLDGARIEIVVGASVAWQSAMAFSEPASAGMISKLEGCCTQVSAMGRPKQSTV